MRHLVASIVAVCALAVPASAAAFCGFYVGGADAELTNKATLVVLMREGTRTVLSMQNNYEGPPSNFAMVVPVPVVLSEDNVKTLDREVFTRVDHLAAPRLVEYWEQDPCWEEPEYEEAPMAMMAMAQRSEEGGMGRRDYGVTIEAQFTVGEYEIVILSAEDSTGLDRWLRDNEYSIPEGAAEVLRPYVEGGMKFFVAKVDVSKVTFAEGRAVLSPLRFHYDSDEFSLPVRLGLLNSSGTQDLVVHILAPNQRYEMANYPNVTIPTNLDVADEVRRRFGEFYAALYDRTLAQNPRAIVTEYAWQATNCDPCPGPVLSVADLSTLGADALPGMSANMRASVAVGVDSVEGRVDRTVAAAIVGTKADALTQCYQAHLDRSGAQVSSARVTFDLEPTGVPRGPIHSDLSAAHEQLKACVDGALADVRFPPPAGGGAAQVRTGIAFSAEPQNPWEVQNRMNSFVLTRLHARYSREALGEDLVFRPASPIVGGREMLGDGGKMEQGATSSGVNNFQGRYAIRHTWEGPIECENPVRGRWGGPPAGHAAPGTEPATDLAFAPRGNLDLGSVLRQDVPELALTAAAAVQPGVSGGVAPPTGAAGGGDGCGCGVAGGAAAPFSALALLGLALAWRRRRHG